MRTMLYRPILDSEERYIISLDRNYNVLPDDIHDPSVTLINECAYMVEDIILPYFEDRIKSVPGIYNIPGTRDYDIIMPDDKEPYYQIRAIQIDDSNLLDVLALVGQKTNDTMFNNMTGDVFNIPENEDDESLVRAFKTVINKKQIHIDYYKNQFSTSAFNNFKRRVDETSMSIKKFVDLCNKFGLGASISCFDKDNPDNTVTITIN